MRSEANIAINGASASLFDMSYAALAEQAGTTLWSIDERFYNKGAGGYAWRS